MGVLQHRCSDGTTKPGGRCGDCGAMQSRNVTTNPSNEPEQPERHEFKGHADAPETWCVVPTEGTAHGYCGQPRESSVHQPAAQPDECANHCGHDAGLDPLGRCLFVSRDAGGSLVYCGHRCSLPAVPELQGEGEPLPGRVEASNGTTVIVSGSLLIIESSQGPKEARFAVLMHEQARALIDSLTAAHGIRATPPPSQREGEREWNTLGNTPPDSIWIDPDDSTFWNRDNDGPIAGVVEYVRATPPAADVEERARDVESVLDSLWQELKTQECADPSTAVRVSMLSEAGFRKAMRPFAAALTPHSEAVEAAKRESGK